jgi:hypothetical protein
MFSRSRFLGLVCAFAASAVAVAATLFGIDALAARSETPSSSARRETPSSSTRAQPTAATPPRPSPSPATRPPSEQPQPGSSPTIATRPVPTQSTASQPPPPQVSIPIPTATSGQAPTYDGPVATTPQEAVDAAVAVGRSRGLRAAVAVYDRQTETIFAAGDMDGAYASASVVKVFIAARLLAEGQADDPTIRNRMWRMIVLSDDDAASALYPLAGAEGLVPWVAERYDLDGLRPASMPGYWGLTRITARSMVLLYDAAARDPAVGPWLLDAMAHTQPTAGDGFAQLFGLPAATTGWRVKQGWMCCLEGQARMHSTGFITGDRYTVAILTEGSREFYGDEGRRALTVMALALLPDGLLP